MPGRIEQIETYAKSLMVGEIAHDYKHVDRVRHWALKIAEREHYPHRDCVQAAALLHDIGLSSGDRKRHGEIGADWATQFLQEHQLFATEEINEIANAIRHHNSLEGDGQLVLILRDADTLDLLGAVGLMRGFTSKWDKPDYQPDHIKGATWGIDADAFTDRFRRGIGVGDYIVDQINFQISCYDNLKTTSAKEFGHPLVAFMQTFMVEFEKQITGINET